jgi:hypothetical protein
MASGSGISDCLARLRALKPNTLELLGPNTNEATNAHRVDRVVADPATHRRWIYVQRGRGFVNRQQRRQ